MTLDPNKGYRALRHGRCSRGGAEYFVTFCSEPRRTALTIDTVAQAIVSEMLQMENETIWSVRCGVVMPDHIHLLFQLGQKLQLGKAVARLKAKSSAHIKMHGLHWQDGYFEHTLRPQEDRLPVFLYIYLNPYRAKLITADQIWPWFMCGNEDRAWLSNYLDNGLPEPTWLAAQP